MSILDAASNAVDGPRRSDYGQPIVNHTCTAEMFAAFYNRRHGTCIEFDAVDVCAFNMAQKLSRLANTPGHRDSLVDIAGYARNWEMVLDAMGDDG